LIYPNAWVFAGGKLDKGESLLEAAQREVFEESGVNVKDLSSNSDLIFMYEAFHGPTRSGRYGHYLIFYYLFDLTVDAADANVNVQEDEVSEYRWVDQEEFKLIVKKGMALAEAGDLYGGEDELEGLHPNKNGVGIAEGSFQVLKAIFGLFNSE
jgi:8-oxo-dGTP pyrophosphatase MutT (NUDIX family)